MHYLELSCRALLALVFTVSAAGKARNTASWRSFTRSLTDLGIAARWAPPAAVTVTAAEALTAASLVWAPSARIGYMLAAGMLLIFTTVIWRTVRREATVRCACFGPSGAPMSRRHLFRNGLLLAVTAGGWALARPGGAHEAAGVAIALGAAFTAGMLVVRFDDLAALVAGPPRTRRESAR
ncbi:MauE/DoxX family redox-associated membrane protein [Planobispora longispora]|uniref:Methylamine utilisation protein MauE domain-containing protein n=1 Tax=Planobispora longispora TaxID=28887 RepID=A0A8J3RH13_9ACTN|nr:MauE/DoxX family redox-associated membrane protein [Planobispora longispora]GIH74076.1 hypothetical protein Plo01_05050 [Planobispora longispora]